MATTTAVLVPSQETSKDISKATDHDLSVFRQLKDFRSTIPKEKLAEWETPSGYITFV